MRHNGRIQHAFIVEGMVVAFHWVLHSVYCDLGSRHLRAHAAGGALRQ